ncbi:MAG: aminodeoxychorismate synthase component I [Treponema sp.]|jgi:para-aminobenzoate synthetase/4-amino-4-deoxychorismate lyase|nr:aminodeoxychorismate synthase component I [Treponema sp.]
MLVYADKRFEHPLQTLMAFNNQELIAAFEAIDAYKDRYFLLGYIRYEAKDVFAGIPVEQDLPLLYFEVFDHFESYTPGNARPVALDLKPALSFEEYAAALEEIREEIAQGNTYEVNYTYAFHVLPPQQQDPLALYEYLLTQQQTPYNCFIQNDYDTVLSFSPELFFELRYGKGNPGGHIRTKPMKGTIPRGKTPEEDAQLRAFLQKDEKNRAENVMIVDLLRNDLGRIAKTGSVKVSQLFTIETHPTLHQMTSQIEGDLKEGTSLYAVFKALFPCGSITGAPKISTMGIIDRVEQGKRHIYCGAIGFIGPGQMTFSVPIRILQRSGQETGFIYRVGGAIVWDSAIQDEWKETLTKTRFLSAGFLLIETMKVEQGRILFKDEHRARLQKSARYFGFTLDERIWAIQPEQDGILRLTVDRHGQSTWEYKALLPACSTQVRISPVQVDSKEVFLYHKTSYRPYFQVNYEIFYDELFCNERGELTEGSRTNMVLEIQGRRYTPPVSCGLLPGLYRQALLDRGECSEKILYPADLFQAEHIYCVNSVRGLQEVTLV